MSHVALVLRHEPRIHLGNLEPVLIEHGYEVRNIEVPSTDLAALADEIQAADLLVVLGGEMGVYEKDEHPFIAHELSLIRRRLDAAAPVFGVCLGAQLMAEALGSPVYKGPLRDIGYRDIRPTDAGADSPVRHVAGVPMLEWHGDHFELPAGAERLATSDAYPNEAWSVGGHALAVQFHPEVTPEMNEAWIVHNEAWLRGSVSHSADELRMQAARHNGAMQDASRAMFSEWLANLSAASRRIP
ncbi:gamma-glutamyl-gamma-aminobutyrate hydrolase family protein [Salinibacterium sp. SYSU T00001]|uniref:glutamine amidotransferase-related protein n=1 Tax=Homoserinimonas sedimenticola TaxID=2986805 RepID=UPI0022355B18|nr:gamma-glutamyl-gamma-aminobutyrate hydrolase family protein [Salinibacterium sedimenticola]MCW4385942.1 gamma-glutamyl-gamma-aminobutyrate hydrolase family protein [Salinibacterium sedimenticola]